MAGIRLKKLKCGSYQGWFYNYQKKRVFFKGTTSKTQTYNLAVQKEKEHHVLWLEGRSPDLSLIPIQKIVDEYFSWGRSQGGRRGFAWSKKTEHCKAYRLNWWIEKLNLKTIGQLERSNILFEAEKAIQDFKVGRAGKTIHLHIECIKSFINWAIRYNFIKENRLKNMTKFSNSPEIQRRALTLEEFKKLYEIAPFERRILYELAINSGLRVNELRDLSENDLLPYGIRLHQNWTKNRIETIQTLPEDLVQRLRDYIASGFAKKAYRERFHGKILDFIPENPMLYVPKHPERALKKDCTKAGIPIETGEGKLDFHSLRVSYITLLVENGATMKEVQELARHSDINLTMNIYAKIRQERIKKLTLNVFRACSGKNEENLHDSEHIEIKQVAIN